MEVTAQQLDSILDFASSKSNISKDFKQGLLRIRKSAMAESVKLKVLKPSQTEAFAFARIT